MDTKDFLFIGVLAFISTADAAPKCDQSLKKFSLAARGRVLFSEKTMDSLYLVVSVVIDADALAKTRTTPQNLIQQSGLKFRSSCYEVFTLEGTAEQIRKFAKSKYVKSISRSEILPISKPREVQSNDGVHAVRSQKPS
jgi:hypothetical protein